MARLKIYDGQEKLKDVELGTDVISIGREPGNQLILPDVSVSRRHAQIEPNGNFFLIRDNGSTNGTFVNETLARVHVLGHGDTVRIGKYLLRVDAGRSKERDSTRVRVEPVSFPAPGGKSTPAQTAAPAPASSTPTRSGPSHDRLLRLYEIQAEIGHIDAPHSLLEHVVDRILAELQADRGGLLLCEKPQQKNANGAWSFEPAAVRCAPGVEADDELVIPEELLAQAASDGQARQIPGTDGKSRPALVAPLRDKGTTRGVVYIDRDSEKGPFSEDDLRFLTAIAGEAAISLANSQLFAALSLEKEKLQAVFTSLTDGVLVTDPGFVVLEANASATVLLGLKDRNPLGANLFDLFSDLTLSPSKDVIQSSGPREGAVFQLARKSTGGKDSVERLMMGQVTPYPAATPDHKGLVVTLRDRSETLRVEELKSQFIGNVAHKLRSPLTVIEGSLPLLRDGSSDVEQILEEVERNSRALCHLVNQFTEFMEMDLRSTKLQTAPQPVKVKQIVREAVRSVEKEASQKGILVVDRVRDDLPLLLGRAERLSRAFLHILENAVKFSGHGGQVVVEAEDLGGCIKIDFTDDGPGIPREQIESVFYVCHQIDSERTGQVPGAGLGLTVARHIVQEHGGEVRITSPHRLPDRGTKVAVVLPSLDPAPRAAAQSQQPAALASEPGGKGDLA